jgi:hypothetical protein
VNACKLTNAEILEIAELRKWKTDLENLEQKLKRCEKNESR